jgi:Domain of unknown function (DUF4166)/Saccharopine dehydrogenase NADP binding domain
MKILILGGYGTFGGRLAQLLADEPRLTLFIAGRSSEKATEFCRSLPASAQLLPLTFDRNREVTTQLNAIKPDIVVDATGPFQMYGAAPYQVIEACIAQRIHYLDLADGSEFVKGISIFDDMAKNHGVFALSGASSFPVLTAAIVRKLSQNFLSIHSIKGGIAPSPYAGVGLNVIRAIAGYAGQPIRLTRDGKESISYALTEIMHYTICPPGKLPLRNTRFSLVDVPDLQVIPDDWPELHSIWMGAGPVPEILHRALNGLAHLVKLKIIPSLLPFAKIFFHAINILRWGEHRGGMFVSVAGLDKDGRNIEHSWHLLAEGNDGPLIPSMAIEAIIRKMLDGKVPLAGARPATHDLEREDYETLFAKRTITTGFRQSLPEESSAPLYQRLLGEAWQKIPEPIQRMHNLRDTINAEGIAQVERGTRLPARLAAALIGFPDSGENVPVQVSFSVDNGRELWKRNFAGKQFTSIQSEGIDRAQHLLMERFGPLLFGIGLVFDQQKLHLIIRNWSLFGIPLPLFLAPKCETYEHSIDGVFHFYIHISHPLTGLIVRYQGHLRQCS